MHRLFFHDICTGYVAEGKARRAKSARRIKSPSHHGPPPVSGNAALVIVRPSLGSPK